MLTDFLMSIWKGGEEGQMLKDSDVIQTPLNVKGVHSIYKEQTIIQLAGNSEGQAPLESF
jgi:hypothetical protein